MRDQMRKAGIIIVAIALLFTLLNIQFPLQSDALIYDKNAIYHLAATAKIGSDGLSYEQVEQLIRDYIANNPDGMPPDGHSWNIAPGSGSLVTRVYQFIPENPKSVIQTFTHQGTYQIPETMQVNQTIDIPISLKSSVTNFPADKATGFIGGLTLSFYVSEDKQNWSYMGQKGYALDNGVQSLQDTYKFLVPDAYPYLVINVTHTNGLFSAMGTSFLYELSASKPTATPTVTPEPTKTPIPSPTATPTPKKANRINIAGEVFGRGGISKQGELMPELTIEIIPSFGDMDVVLTDENGFYTWSADWPEGDDTAAITIRAVLHCQRTGRVAFQILRDQSEVVWASSTLTVDRSEPTYQGLEEIVLMRPLSFVTVASGYLSKDEKGKPEPMTTSSSVSNARLSGYSFVFRQIHSGIVTAEKVFNEYDAMYQNSLLVSVDTILPKEDTSHFSGHDASKPIIRLLPEDSQCDDNSRYVVLHEFGHYFDWATNHQGHRAQEGADYQNGDKNHGGYMNQSTSDSIIEGFAQWYTVQVQKLGPYPMPGKHMDMALLGMLSEPWVAYGECIYSEEMAIAKAFDRLTDLMGVQAFWEVLSINKKNLFEYYQEFADSAWGKAHQKELDQVFIDCGLYKMPFGNGKQDEWEPYRMMKKAKETDPDVVESYADLMFADKSRTKPIRALTSDEKIVVGQSSDALRNRYTQVKEPNSWLALTGMPVDTLYVQLETENGKRAYTVSAMENRVYLSLPIAESEGYLTVSVPGGKQIYRENIRTLQKKFAETRYQETVLDTAGITEADLPDTPGIVNAVEGYAEMDPFQALEADAITQPQDEKQNTQKDDAAPSKQTVESEKDSIKSNDREDRPENKSVGAGFIGFIGAMVLASGTLIVILVRKNRRKPKQ